ncbi:MAG: transaldolase family protein [bacterium]|nr:transaldolase family protein [bacterium]
MGKNNLASKILIDGGDPNETLEAKKLLGHIDGQTTNPTLISKNPEVAKYLASGKKLTHEEAWQRYREIAREIAKITDGPISLEVYANLKTPFSDMIYQARDMFSWIPNAYIKVPCTHEGLKAAEVLKNELRLNFTLNFSQEQAAAVYSASLGGKFPCFVSPFVGRIDDRGENGMDLVKNELQMFAKGDQHVEVLAASIRSLPHLLYALKLKSPLITLPFKVFKEWADLGFSQPEPGWEYDPGDKKLIPYRDDLTLDKPWYNYNLDHELTTVGVERFAADWDSLIQKPAV